MEYRTAIEWRIAMFCSSEPWAKNFFGSRPGKVVVISPPILVAMPSAGTLPVASCQSKQPYMMW
eukprot:SAG22_NODE_3514_length_1669_cov_1.398089_1_plen_64_part_00